MEDVDDAFARWEAFQRQVPSPTHPMMAPQPVKQEINFNPATVNKGQPEAPVEPSRESQQDKNIGQVGQALTTAWQTNARGLIPLAMPRLGRH